MAQYGAAALTNVRFWGQSGNRCLPAHGLQKARVIERAGEVDFEPGVKPNCRGKRMSVKGQKQTSRNVRVISALLPIADIRQCGWDVRKVPEADMVSRVATLGSAIRAQLHRRATHVAAHWTALCLILFRF